MPLCLSDLLAPHRLLKQGDTPFACIPPITYPLRCSLCSCMFATSATSAANLLYCIFQRTLKEDEEPVSRHPQNHADKLQRCHATVKPLQQIRNALLELRSNGSFKRLETIRGRVLARKMLQAVKGCCAWVTRPSGKLTQGFLTFDWFW
eukprot:1136595-Pelagomonas_calceolata.AAC.1